MEKLLSHGISPIYQYIKGILEVLKIECTDLTYEFYLKSPLSNKTLFPKGGGAAFQDAIKRLDFLDGKTKNIQDKDDPYRIASLRGFLRDLQCRFELEQYEMLVSLKELEKAAVATLALLPALLKIEKSYIEKIKGDTSAITEYLKEIELSFPQLLDK
jgi:hypothetical protein